MLDKAMIRRVRASVSKLESTSLHPERLYLKEQPSKPTVRRPLLDGAPNFFRIYTTNPAQTFAKISFCG